MCLFFVCLFVKTNEKGGGPQISPKGTMFMFCLCAFFKPLICLLNFLDLFVEKLK